MKSATPRMLDSAQKLPKPALSYPQYRGQGTRPLLISDRGRPRKYPPVSEFTNVARGSTFFHLPILTCWQSAYGIIHYFQAVCCWYPLAANPSASDSLVINSTLYKCIYLLTHTYLLNSKNICKHWCSSNVNDVIIWPLYRPKCCQSNKLETELACLEFCSHLSITNSCVWR